MLHVFPVCCYSLAVTTGKRAFRRRALRRPHPARREVPCGDTDMDWPRPGAVLHTTGPWGRSYLGVGRRAASRAWQRALSKGRHGFTFSIYYNDLIFNGAISIVIIKYTLNFFRSFDMTLWYLLRNCVPKMLTFQTSGNSPFPFTSACRGKSLWRPPVVYYVQGHVRA